jgi:hypothetical protein
MIEILGLQCNAISLLEGKNMNMFKTTKITMSVAAAMLALTFIVRAGDAPKANPYVAVLSTVTQAELPAKAADLVGKADVKQQKQTTIDVVTAAVGLNPAAAAAIVGSIAQTAPDMAPVAASTASSLVPAQAAAIARAAAAVAPKQAGNIVESICSVLPASYFDVAEAVSEVVPSASKDILNGVATAIPSLKAPINSALLANPATPTVAAVLASMPATAPSTGLAGGSPISSAGINPIVNPPYVSPPSSPVNLSPNGPGSGQVPVGGRTYANP